MHVIMLSWEYPPRVVGGIARHVEDLAKALVRQGVDVDVITCAHDRASEEEDDEGVKVFRVPFQNPSPPDFITWVMQMNLNLLERGIERAGMGAHLVHSHDWVVAYSAKVLKHAFNIPLVATIHATEYGRNWGLHNDLQRYISNVEWWLGFEAWRVICCSEYMRQELSWIFQLPGDKLSVIPNGVEPGRFDVPSGEDLAAFKSQWATPDEKIIFYIGRLVHEKGVHILLDAFSKVLAYRDKTKLVIAGKGPAAPYLKEHAQALGIYNRVFFAGFVDDSTRNRLYKCSDVAVVPSLYEPFGITALEAMASGTPVVVSDVGGLGEVVRHGVTGMKCYAGNPNSLADNILTLLADERLCDGIRANATSDVLTKFNWDIIAEETWKVYDEVYQAYRSSPWAAARPGWIAAPQERIPPEYSRYLAYDTI